MRPHALFTNDPDLYGEMCQWPNTPGHHRYIQAAIDYAYWNRKNDALEHDCPEAFQEALPGENKPFEEYTDLDLYGDLDDTRNWEENAECELAEDLTYLPHLALRVIIMTAMEGASETTIPIALCRYTPTIADPETRVSLTRLSRHPDWMGMSPALADIHGFTAFVLQDQETDTPALVILTNKPPDLPSSSTITAFPEGQATVLKTLLTKMGATPLWFPWDGDPDNHPDIPIHGEPVAVPTFRPTGIYAERPEPLFSRDNQYIPSTLTVIRKPTYKHMANWPHTPDPDRFIKAYELFLSHTDQYRAGEAEEPDSKNFPDYTDFDHYFDLVHTDMMTDPVRQLLAIEYVAAEHALTLPAVARIASILPESSIGLAIYDPALQDPKHPLLHVTITRLSRHTDWMGLNPNLPKLKDLQAIIFRDPDAAGPHLIIAAPPRRTKSTQPEDPVPHTPEAKALHKILLFHRATPTWAPLEAEPPVYAQPILMAP